MKVSSTSIQLCKGAHISYFKINAPIFCCPLFFEEYLNLQVRINKMGNEHTIDYHPSPSELTSRIHPLIFLWSSKGFISLEYLLNFFSNLYIPPTVVAENMPLDNGGRDGHGPPLFLKSYFARKFFMEICFCVVLHGIQNFFGSGTPRIFGGPGKISNLWC